ncbi:hypothetical protein [Campylobacter troglodytis]|uniref:hypothetical protein n=1 Tax=Campylobacter troglodytis TaxID=654363 RepID=UPI00115A837F|nr:hypothetical protein [Campylobacter troglodytis]TQR60869.1 hypothetical protein DMC01_03880 [Campylobacter troglodytis]
MLVNINDKNNYSTFSTTTHSKERDANEFQARLNELTKDEKGGEGLKNSKLDLSEIKAKFISYAQGKMYEDGLKKAENDHLNKLFELIDSNNKAR